MKKLRILWDFMRGNRNLYIFSVLAVGFATFIRFIWPVILRMTVDSIIGDKPLQDSGWLTPLTNFMFNVLGGRPVLLQALWICSSVLILLTLSRGIFIFFKGKLSAVASESIAKNLRDRLYDHIQYLPFNYHVKVKTGDLIQRCTSDLETIRRFLAIQLVEVGRALFMVGFALSFMLPLNVKMTLVSMFLVPPLFFFALIFFQKIKHTFKASDEAEARLSTVLQENLTGVRVVRAFARQSYEIRKFDSKNGEYRDLTYRLIRLLAWYWAISDFLSMIQIAAVISLGAYWAAQGYISLGTMLAFSSYVGMLLWPVRQMGRVLTDMGKALVSVERIQEILQLETEKILSGKSFKPLKGKLEFRDVSFGYEHNNPVLKKISFKVEPGQMIAVLGPTGSGKSTLVNLLPRLYDYQEGSIFLDGKELKEYDIGFLRRNISIILQEPFLYSRSIKENIELGSRNCREEEIFKAAKTAFVHDVILDFDQGYETRVGERGVTLSGGQKQRIAIARALIRKSPVLIFDDSLSAVDTETDALIRKELLNRRNRVTTFIISHRLNTLAEADKILVIEKGELVQQGTHFELVSQDGLYRRVWEIQNELEEELSAEIGIEELKKQEYNLNKQETG